MKKKRTVEGQLIGSKLNDVKNTSRKRIQSLINQQRKQDRNIEQYTNVDSQIEDITNESNISIQQTENYDITAPEHSDQTPIPVTQDESYDENTDNGMQKQNKTFNTNRIQVQNPNGPACISQTALYSYLGNALIDDAKHFVPRKIMVQPPLMQTVFNIAEVANSVVHPITNKKTTKYHKLIYEPLLREVWMKSMCVELGRLAQLYKYTKGTETVKFMTWKEINQIPADRTATYARIVVDYRAQKRTPTE